MKVTALSLLIILGSSGTVFADQNMNDVNSYSNKPELPGIVTQDIGKEDSKGAKEASLNAAEGKSKSLKERDRERKGLPRYWNG